MIKLILEKFFTLPEKIRFIIIGGWNTFVGYTTFIIIWFLLKNILHYQLILLLTYIIASFQTFFTLKYFVFKTKGEFKKEYPRCFISSILGLLINALLLMLFVDVFGLNVIISQTIAIVITVIANYFLHKYFTFQMHKHEV